VMQLLQRAAGAGGASTTRITGSRVRLVSNADGSSGSGGSKVVRLGSPPTTRQGTAGAGGSGGKKRVVWRDDRGGKLVAVRWFCKEDPASSVSAVGCGSGGVGELRVWFARQGGGEWDGGVRRGGCGLREQ
jgi:hypothetical protein